MPRHFLSFTYTALIFDSSHVDAHCDLDMRLYTAGQRIFIVKIRYKT